MCDDLEAFNRADPPRLPGGVLCQEQNPQKVLALRDPNDTGRDYAYEATSGGRGEHGARVRPERAADLEAAEELPHADRDARASSTSCPAT